MLLWFNSGSNKNMTKNQIKAIDLMIKILDNEIEENKKLINKFCR